MNTVIREIIGGFNSALLTQLDNALKLRVTNFRRGLFPSLGKIYSEIPGAGFQYVIWIKHEPKYPFPGFEFDQISRPMKYIPDYLASGMKFANIARGVAHLSGGHVEDYVKVFYATLMPAEHRYQMMPLGTLARKRRLIDLLGANLTRQLYEFAVVLVNKAKHEFGVGSPYPVISFPDALGGYFASRILGFQVLQRAGLLETYVEAVEESYSKGIVYAMPEGSDPGDDDKVWPLQADPSELENDSERV
jgi:hypothetical protein